MLLFSCFHFKRIGPRFHRPKEARMKYVTIVWTLFLVYVVLGFKKSWGTFHLVIDIRWTDGTILTQALWFFCSSSAGTGSTRRSNVRSELLLGRPRKKLREPQLLQLTISLPVIFCVVLFSVNSYLVRLYAKGKANNLQSFCWTTQIFPSTHSMTC